MRMWSACFDFSLLPFPPFFLSSFLHPIYATNISKHLFGAWKYAIKDPDSLQIAFILGWGRKEGGSALRAVRIADKEA